jgi:DNA primase
LLFQKGRELYGLYQAIQANRKLHRIMVVEGYMDVIALFQQGITYAVATLGTATTSHHLQRLFRYTTDIVFCFDGDSAGRMAAWRALEVILPLMYDKLQIRFLFLPDGEDPDTLVRKENKLQFEQRLESALSLSAFFFQTLSQKSDIELPEGRACFAAQALYYIKQLPKNIFQSILIEELAKRARVDIDKLKQQVKTIDRHQYSVQPAISQADIKFPTMIRCAIALLIQYPHLATLTYPPLPTIDLPGYAFLLNLLQILQTNPTMTVGMLKEHWRDRDEAAWIAKLANWEHMVPGMEVESEFLGAIRQLILHSYDIEIDRLLAKAAQSGLIESEKQALVEWISKKKQLATTPI